MIKTCRFIVIIAFLVLQSPSHAGAGDYIWPMKIAPRLSSHFGDYRPGHWHAGIDITTRGKIGYRVYAVADGYIFRVRTAFWGYGKALYLKLDNGRYAVYGHLDRFSPDIENLIRAKQMRDKKFYQDVYFEPGRFRVKQGDYIALSGQTGAGAPHLHFEIRDANNYPINLLKDIYKIPDTVAPIVDRLLIRRYGKFGLANYNDWEFLRLEGEGPELHANDTIAVYGQSVFAISGYDPGVGYNYGLYGTKLKIDSTEVFAFEQNRLDYTAGAQIDYVRDHELQALIDRYEGDKGDFDKDVFYKLYVQPDDHQSFYGAYSYPSGIIFADSLDPATHEVLISAYDIGGNTCDIRFYMRAATLPAPQILRMAREADSLKIMLGAVSVNCQPAIQGRKTPLAPYQAVPELYDVFSGRVAFSLKPQFSDYRIRIQNGPGDVSPWINFIAEPDSQQVLAYADRFVVIHPQSESVSINGRPVLPLGSIPFPDNFMEEIIPVSPIPEGIRLRFGEDSQTERYFIFNADGTAISADSAIELELTDNFLYGPTVLSITSPQSDNAGGYYFSILPENALFAGPATIGVRPGKLGIEDSGYSIYYYLENKDDWIFVGEPSGSGIIGQTNGGGKFGILLDNKPPTISSIRPRNGSTISQNTPNLRCVIDDKLSGISEETQLQMTIDGLWVPAYYDIDNKSYAYQVRHGLSSGRHLLKITAMDNQGNRAEAVSRFTLSGSGQ